MIELYTGTPGSGKSLEAAQRVRDSIRFGHPVIANFPINMDVVKRKVRKNRTKSTSLFYYWDNTKMTVAALVEYARKNHKPGREGQTLIVIDECAVQFNSRDWVNNKDRMNWIKFFIEHRKLGYDVLLICQNDRQIDRQIRALVETEVKHRKVNNAVKWGLGQIFDALGMKVFVAVSYWYGVNQRVQAHWFTYKAQDAKLYDSYAVFSMDGGPEAEQRPEPSAAAAEGVPKAGAPRRRPARPPATQQRTRNTQAGTRGRSSVQRVSARSSVPRHASFRLTH